MDIISITRPKPEVRIGLPADEQEVYRLLLLGHAENGLAPANNQKVMFYVKRFLYGQHIPPDDMGPRGVFGVIGEPGKTIKGLVMIGIGSFWYSDHKHLEEFILYVDPQFRNGTGGVGLANALIDWAKMQKIKTNIPYLTGILSNHRTEAKCRLYRRKLKKIGEYFLEGDFYSDELLGITQVSSRAA